MISVTDALSHIAENRPTSGTETVTLRSAVGRKLARDIVANVTHPSVDSSAMDGYAVRLADIATAGAQLAVIGESPAGAPFAGQVNLGQAVRIFTGGAMPAGADTVVIQENVSLMDGVITVLETQSASRHIRRAGLDFYQGDILILSGTVLGPAEVAVTAAAGHAEVTVNRMLKVAILSGGDELIAPGVPLAPGQVTNSNPYALAALIESWGHSAQILKTAKDSMESLAESLAAAGDADVIIPVGGASVGDHDYMRRAFRSAGLEMVFEKIGVRPGKPTWFGRLNGRPVLGLPGNPASALVCAELFVRPLLTGEPAQFITAKLTQDVKANGPRESYQRAVITANGAQLSVTPLPIQDSGLMTPFLTANGLLKLSANNPAQPKGQPVEVLPIKSLK